MRKSDIYPITMHELVKKYQLPNIDTDIATIDTLKRMAEVIGARRLSLCTFIGICTSGVATVQVNGWKRVATSMEVMIITDESVVNDISFSDDFDGYGVFLSYAMTQDILRDLQNISNLFLISHNHPVFGLTETETTSIVDGFKLLNSRIQSKQHTLSREVARLSILAMIYEAVPAINRIYSESIPEDKRSRAERIFVTFMHLLEENYKTHRTVSWYAEQMHLTAKYLSESVSSVSRRSPNQWIDKFVCTEIRSQLRHTNKPMAQIAKELNFSTQSFFGRYFRTNTGISPTDYRNGIEGRKL